MNNRTKAKLTRKYSTDGEGVTRYFTKWLWDIYPNTLSKKELVDRAMRLFENPRNHEEITPANVNFALCWMVKWGVAVKGDDGRFQSTRDVSRIIDVLAKQVRIKRFRKEVELRG